MGFFDSARFGCEHITSFKSVYMQKKYGGSIRSHDTISRWNFLRFAEPLHIFVLFHERKKNPQDQILD